MRRSAIERGTPLPAMWIASAEHSRALDRRTTDFYGIPSRVLMERAGLAVFHAVNELLNGHGRLSICCGKGNNGGDGFVVARLAQEAGYVAECLVSGEEYDLTGAACEQMQVARAQGVQVIFVDDARWQKRLDSLGNSDLIVDALLGTGARLEVKSHVFTMIKAINRSGVPVVAVDVPSGIDCDTGEELGESVWALRTVTFGLPKPYLFQGLGLEHAGHWTVSEIGIPNVLLQEATQARLIDLEWVTSLLPERLRASHKMENGHLLIVAGSDQMRGAAVMAARGAMRSGVGVVTVASTEKVCDAVAANLPEAMLMPLRSELGVISPENIDAVLNMSERCHATVFGPGLTTLDPIVEFLAGAWREWKTPCVIDADAISIASRGVPLPKSDCVLTPHSGEMSRLLHCSVAEIQSDRFTAVTQAIYALDKTILLKGPYTIAGEPGTPMIVNHTGNPGLASAGVGDVLSGVIGTLLAQELSSYNAASCGMYWHGLAGDICAEEIGAIGYSATDVANALPKARAKMVAACDQNSD